jgi:hypothetical protein
MTEWRVLFCAEMVRAYQRGAKTQTRRVLTPRRRWRASDVLLVGESLRPNAEGTVAIYAADALPVMVGGESLCWRWQKRFLNGMFCPRQAVRYRLVLTRVWTHHLQSLSEADAMAEGCLASHMAVYDCAREWYRAIWNGLHPRGPSWDDNPTVLAAEWESYVPDRRELNGGC